MKYCFLSFIATDDKDRQGLKLEKVGPTFLSCHAIRAKMTKKKIVGVMFPDKICLISLPQLFRSIFCMGKGTE